MSREELIRRTYYSFFYETMLSTLYGRIDRTLTFAQILLGSVVLASFWDPVFTGVIIVTFSTILFAWQPAKSSLQCDVQAKKMKVLINGLDTLDDASLYQEYLKAQEGDSPNIGSLRDPALKRAYIVLDRKDDARGIKLSRYQKFLCHLAGDLPKD